MYILRIISVILCLFILVSIKPATPPNPTKPQVDPAKPKSVDISTMCKTEPVGDISMPEPNRSIPAQLFDGPDPVYIPPITIDPQDLEYLACVIYQEAGGDRYCDECRRRVADVVLNRVESPRFPNTIKKVLLAEGQYGRLHWTGIVWPERAKYAGEAHAVERAYRIAEEVLSGQHSELYGQGYIWQAEFIQGKDNIYCCGHYFGR